MTSEDHSFAKLVKGREDEFPVLAIASRATVAAQDVLIEWTNYGEKLRKNWQQIFRSSWHGPVPQGSDFGDIGPETSPDAVWGSALTRFLGDIELALVHGIPWREQYVATLGGVRHFLGRDLVIGDRIRLRPLREPMLRTYYGWSQLTGLPHDHPTYEWLCETSLQVSPA